MIDEARAAGHRDGLGPAEAQQPQCGYCALGLSCRNCAMGPCRIDPFGEGPQKGVCGADADVIVARNLGRAIAAGSSSHSDHGRDILETFRSLAHGRDHRLPDRRRGQAAPARRRGGRGHRGPLGRGGGRRPGRRAPRGLRHASAASLSFVERVPEVRRDEVGRRSASRRGASTGRTSRCSTAPTWAWTTTT